MDSTALMVWNSFLRSAPADQQASLFQCISPQLLEQLQNQPSPSASLRQGMEPIEEELPLVHYSWFSPALRSLPENEIRLFLSPLTAEQIKRIEAEHWQMMQRLG